MNRGGGREGLSEMVQSFALDEFAHWRSGKHSNNIVSMFDYYI